MYADDLVLISKSEEGLQRQIDTLNEYSKNKKLKINTQKQNPCFLTEGTKL